MEFQNGKAASLDQDHTWIRESHDLAGCMVTSTKGVRLQQSEHADVTQLGLVRLMGNEEENDNVPFLGVLEGLFDGRAPISP
jgi:hypothetical protein